LSKFFLAFNELNFVFLIKKRIMSDVKSVLINNIGNAIHISVKSIEGGNLIPAGVRFVDVERNTLTFLKGRALAEIKEVEKQKLPLEQRQAAIDAIIENAGSLCTVSIDEVSF
jgi:hypothetical protein